MVFAMPVGITPKMGNHKKTVSRVLLWIDGAYHDFTARLVRGFALGEAFRQSGVDSVTMACPETDGAFLDSNLFRINLIDISKKSSLSDLQQIITEQKPDIIIADVVSSAKVKEMYEMPQKPFFVLLADAFSESLFLADMVLLPGMIPYPNFEEMDMLPSHIDKTRHGMNYLLFPSGYHQPVVPAQSSDSLCLALSGNPSRKDIQSLVDMAESIEAQPYLFADVPAPALWQIRKETRLETMGSSELTIKQRIAAIDRARMIVAFPSIHVYEFLARGKAVLLLPRTDFEKRICADMESENMVRVFSQAATNEIPALRQKVQELWSDEALLASLADSARPACKECGANRTVAEILKRFAG
jgi:hypothetical protein